MHVVELKKDDIRYRMDELVRQLRQDAIADITVEVRDDVGLLMRAKFSFDIVRKN
jgi:hypothetical protein